jgi:hypothetical protein
MSKWRYLTFVALIVLVGLTVKGYSLYQTTRASVIEHWQLSDEDNKQSIDHHVWQTLLSTYVLHGKTGINTFNYQSVTSQDKQKLTHYLSALQQLKPTRFRKNEQLAYWVNLYNALTVDIVLRHFPIDSIKDIGDGFTGPWNIEVAVIEGRPITLNKIEHGILRPLWRDNRIHYVINCASVGCPDLPKQVFSSVAVDKQLNSAAKRFINQGKGAHLSDNVLTLSSIYNWFSADFGDTEKATLDHIKIFASPELKQKLTGFSGEVKFTYNWKLNAPESGLQIDTIH